MKIWWVLRGFLYTQGCRESMIQNIVVPVRLDSSLKLNPRE